jgi:adenylyltransferase/sulfurtransferase
MHDRLLMYDSLPCSFINLKKPPPRPNCAICSSQATIHSIEESQLSLQNTRGPVVCAMPNQGIAKLPAEQRISCQGYNTTIRKASKPHILLDVRATQQYEMCSLDGSINIPLDQLQSQLPRIEELSNGNLPIYCLCRRGIASVEATRILQQYKEDGSSSNSLIHSVYNIDGGLNEWVKRVDSDFPWY